MISGCTPHVSDATAPIASVGIIGVGNALAGDDAAGIRAAEALRSRLGARPDLFFHLLEGDPFEMADLLDEARHFIFIDACIGTVAGERMVRKNGSFPAMSSLHQTDIGTVMLMLQSLRLVDPFPTWELTAISIVPPLDLGAPLSPAVAEAVDRTVEELSARLSPAFSA